MILLLRAVKTEIQPTKNQITKINCSIGIARFLYNKYIAYNYNLYKMYQRGLLDIHQKHFITAYEFDKYVNHTLKKELVWICECGSKARKQALINAEQAFRNYMKGRTNCPKFKKKNQQKIKIYFPKNGKGDWTIWRHKVKIPTIGIVKLKEKGYLPTNAKVRSGTVSYKASRYYVSILIELPEIKPEPLNRDGLGIDLGIKELAVMSDGTIKSNINKTLRVKKLEKKLRREQRCLSRKYEFKKKRGEKPATYSANIDHQIVKIQRIHQMLTNIRVDYENKIISSILKRKPSFVVLEDLNVKGMMKNQHLSKAISAQRFFYFRTKLIAKAKQIGIEVRIVNRFYPSSKKCSRCGKIKHDLKLRDRIYCCECGLIIDRDLNAAINLKNALEYDMI